MRRILSAVLCLLLAAALCVPMSASAIYYENGVLTLVSEPEEFLSDIAVYRGEEKLDAAALTWVEEGHTGKALLLPGDGTFLRLSHEVTRVTRFTFSAWISWQGGESGQRLFTIARGTENFLTVSPYIRDDARGINGVYLGYQYGGTGGKKVSLFNETAGDASYALPREEWHHLAVVSDNRSFRVYIDGVPWLSEQVLGSLYEMKAYSLDIGTGEWGDPTLHALLDDVVIYSSPLSERRIKELAGEQAPLYLPTRPAVTTAREPAVTAAPTTPATEVQTLSPTIFGVPVWAVGVIGVLILAYITVTVIANLAQNRRKEGEDEE